MNNIHYVSMGKGVSYNPETKQFTIEHGAKELTFAYDDFFSLRDMIQSVCEMAENYRYEFYKDGK